MKPSSPYEPLLIRQLDLNDLSCPPHAYTHCELILIQTGSGCHQMNGQAIPYQAGEVYLLGPADRHSFQVHQRTRIYTLSFTMSYLTSLFPEGAPVWIQPGKALQPQGALLGRSTNDWKTYRMLLALVRILLAEQPGARPSIADPIVESLMKTIVGLIDRHLVQQGVGHGNYPLNTAPLIQRMVEYIRQHIAEPDRLRVDRMADVFHYSPSRLAALFKQKAGESLQQYIIRHRLERVVTLLTLSSMSISQIADEFGFADVCHLNKLFKRHYQHTPSHFRTIHPGATVLPRSLTV